MHRLTREVRFSLVADTADQLRRAAPNGFAGHPAGGTEIAPFLILRVTLAGPLDPSSNYVQNIVEMDSVVRRIAIPLAADALARRTGPAALIRQLFTALADSFPGSILDSLSLSLTPFIRCSCRRGGHHPEQPMIRLSQKYEFSASHRLHNPALGEAENRACFGKCNNPHGHGHNYELEVAVRCPDDPAADPIDLPLLHRIVNQTIIDRFDHRYLNVEVPPFDTLIPTVENIARVIHGLLKPALAAGRIDLAAVTVWETGKTWCQYSDGDNELY